MTSGVGDTLNRRFLLKQRPTGDFVPELLERVVEPIPRPSPGEALVKNLYLSLDPSNRVWIGEGESYMPPMAIGEVMRGAGVGKVIASHTRKFPVGAHVLGFLGWQDYAVIRPDSELPCQRLPPFLPFSLSSMLSALGVTGMTAYFAMLHVARPRKGETVVVSSAAGAVGSIAGQLAKLRGARVVGIAGSKEKCDWLTSSLGFDHAICRRDPDWRQQLSNACPNGVDIDFENVGGEMMEAVFDLLNTHARVVLCGLISQYGADGEIQGPRNFANLLMRRITVHGFNILDYLPHFTPAIVRMGVWLWRGKIKDHRTIVRGLDNAPQALVGLFKGQSHGKVLVEI